VDAFIEFIHFIYLHSKKKVGGIGRGKSPKKKTFTRIKPGKGLVCS